jgi:hypothetical protein
VFMVPPELVEASDAKKLSVNSTLLFRTAFHAVFGRRHGNTQAS